jgi:hypothetical protein
MAVLLRRGLPLGVLLGALSLAGCKKELPKQQTYPTRGTVMWNGEPVRFALIRLVPADSSAGQPADGFTDEDGNFTLRTYSNDEPDGAAPGTYEVELDPYDSVRAPRIPKGAKPTALTSQARKPGITVEVKEEENELEVNIP